MRSLGANLGAIRANDFPRKADECGQAARDHARWRTDLDDAERDTGNYGSDARAAQPRVGSLWPGHAWATSHELSRLPAVTHGHSAPVGQLDRRS